MKGIYSALLVPFDDNGKILEESLRTIVRYNIDVCHVDGLYVNGSSGESFLLSLEEKKLIFKIVQEEAQGKIHLMGQIGSLNFYESVELGKYIKTLGYDAASAVTPFYYNYNANDLKRYYDDLIAEIDMPFVIYYIPQLSKVNLDLKGLKQIMNNKKIIGIKYSSTDLFFLTLIRKEFKDKLIFFGWDECLQLAALLQVDGLIGSTYNVNGLMAKKLYESTKQGDIEEVNRLTTINTNFIQEVVKNGVFQTLKAIIEIKTGIDMGTCRKPLTAISQQHKEVAHKIIKTYLKTQK